MMTIPAVGDRRFESYLVRMTGGTYILSPPEPCIVTYVNYPHRWYEAYFERFGLYCGFKFDEPESNQGADLP